MLSGALQVQRVFQHVSSQKKFKNHCSNLPKTYSVPVIYGNVVLVGQGRGGGGAQVSVKLNSYYCEAKIQKAFGILYIQIKLIMFC